MNLVRLHLLAAMFVMSNSAFSTDWHFAGYVKFEKPGSLVFFDNDGIVKSGNTVTVWTQGVPIKYFKRNLTKQEMHDTEDKLLNGKVPRYLQIPDVRKKYKTDKEFLDIELDILMYETLVSFNSFQVSVRALQQIDCQNKTLKLLDITVYNTSGDIKSTGQDSSTSPIAPETNADWLYQMICK